MGAGGRKVLDSCSPGRSPRCPSPEATPPDGLAGPRPHVPVRPPGQHRRAVPDPLTPLFADLIDGVGHPVAAGLIREFRGEDVIRDHDIGLPTVNGYAYYRYSRSGMARLMWTSPGLSATDTGAGQERPRPLAEVVAPAVRRAVHDWTAGRRG